MHGFAVRVRVGVRAGRVGLEARGHVRSEALLDLTGQVRQRGPGPLTRPAPQRTVPLRQLPRLGRALVGRFVAGWFVDRVAVASHPHPPCSNVCSILSRRFERSLATQGKKFWYRSRGNATQI